MSKRYLIASYAKDVDKTPTILSSHMFDVKKDAEKQFTDIARRKIRSVVLYDRKADEVVKVAIHGEPIYLVKAVEVARGKYENKVRDYVCDKTKEAAASAAIGAIAKALIGEAVPKVGDVVVAHFMGPYYALQGDSAGVASTAGGLWGGLSGAVVGTLVGGPIGGIVGGIVGGSAASVGASAIVKSFEPPKHTKNVLNVKEQAWLRTSGDVHGVKGMDTRGYKGNGYKRI